MKFDEYTLKARMFPAFLIVIPITVLVAIINDTKLDAVLKIILGIKTIGVGSMGLLLMIFLSQINRYISKFIFENSVFSNELNFPTTRFLLFSDSTYSETYKIKIHKQIKKDFNIDIPAKDIEIMDETTSRKVILEAVSKIRLKMKSGRLLLQHNIEYGFWRNFIGGSIIGAIFTIGILIIFIKRGEWVIVGFALILLIVYAGAFVFRRMIMNNLGIQYAKILFQEYTKK